MASKRNYNLSLKLDEKTLSFFPDAIGKEDTAFRNAVTARVRAAFEHLDGVLQSISVSDTLVKITWQEDQGGIAHVEKIAQLLTGGNYADGIFLLELFISSDPEDPVLLYNLGMAYSDQNNIKRAIALLARLIEIAPEHVNGRVALGVALLRDNQVGEGISELETAIKEDPQNLWARRNLGAGLIKLGQYPEAEEHLRVATEIGPEDQPSWYGYGQALEQLGKLEDADAAYIKTIEIDEYTDIAELARKARSKLAQKSFRSVIPGVERVDAVMYCLVVILHNIVDNLAL
jgi:tetratricopeptide (TPR) repeat protein